MKVLNIAADDWANLAYSHHRALQSIGVESECLVLNSHLFAYSEQGRVVTEQEMITAAKQADIIQAFHSPLKFASWLRELRKPVIVHHTGTVYRQSPAAHNLIWNSFVYRCVTDQVEFMDLGAKDIIYCACAVDTHSRKLSYGTTEPFRFSHYPSNPETKGTQEIKKVFNSFGNAGIFRIDTERVSHTEQLQRMMDCDIYVEMLKPEQNGKPYGCFGVTAFEAAAMGKIVVTNCIAPEVYQDAYDELPFIVANSTDQLREVITHLLHCTLEEIVQMKMETFTRVNQLHGYRATGRYIVKKILPNL